MPMSRPLRSRLMVAAAGLVVVLATAACSRPGADDRRRAVDRLREIDRLLTDLGGAYAAGKREQAGHIAAKIVLRYDETIAERVVNQLDRSLARALDSVLEKQLPEKVRGHAPASEVAALVARGHDSVAKAIRVIGR